MEIHAWSVDGPVCFIVHEHLLRPLSRLVKNYRPGNQEDRLIWESDVDRHFIGPQTIRSFLHWLYYNSLGSVNSAGGRDLNADGIEDHQLRTIMWGMR